MNKKTISVLLIAAILYSCGNNAQTKAVDEAKQLQQAIKQNTPGSIATSAAGYSMKAKINGKEWIADAMMPPEAAGRIIGYKDDENIGLPYDKRNMVVGNKIVFGENNAADLFSNDEVGIWGGRAGEMEITKVEGEWAEGKFYFTGSTSRDPNKKIEVTDGFFRISMVKK